MKIVIKIEGDEKQEEMTFTDEFLDNPNYIEMWIEDKSYLVLKDDLDKIASLFY